MEASGQKVPRLHMPRLRFFVLDCWGIGLYFTWLRGRGTLLFPVLSVSFMDAVMLRYFKRECIVGRGGKQRGPWGVKVEHFPLW